MSGDLREKLLDHIRSSGLFEEPGLALLAVSGGADSIALLDLMVALAPELDLELTVGHVDHGISEAAAAAVPHIEDLAKRYLLPCTVEVLQLGPKAGETLARTERYRALRKIQDDVGARYLVTAHQADDQAETVLYRVLRGTGVFGLSAIPARGPRGLVRPLLPFTRDQLLTWLHRQFPDPQSRPFVFEDPANIDERHDRVWLRRTVMPLLRARLGVDLDQKLAQTARDAATDRQAWASLLRASPELEFSRGARLVEVARAPLQRYDKVLSEGLLRALAREVGCVLGPRRAARLRAFVTGSTSGRRLQLGAGWEAELSFGRIRILAANRDEFTSERPRLSWGETESGCVRWADWEFTWHTANADATRRDAQTTWVTLGPGEIRLPRAGDRMVPLGGVGRRKVRRILMEARIPAGERQYYPVVVRGPDIIWIPGICRSSEAIPRIGEEAIRLDARSTDRS